MFFCDSLETGANSKDISKALESSYCIWDKESAIEVSEWLCNRGHRIYFDAIKEFLAEMSSSINDSMLLDDEKSRTYEFIKNLNTTIEKLIYGGYLNRKEYLRNQSIVAWDMGRLVWVARCSYEVGYISKNEAWFYIEDAHRQCEETYRDWKGVADGYIIRRCMWGGPSVMDSGLMGIISDLLTDNDSPWVNFPLR